MLGTVHFIAGLPRSGSTLLSAILRQNPRFHAGVTSPVAMLCGKMLHNMSGATEFASFFSDKRRRAILRGIFQSYYETEQADRVVFDTNRSWTGQLPLLRDLFPNSKIICCVRDVAWVIDSVERLVRRNAMQPSKLFNYKTGGSVYSRVETLMDPQAGLIGLAWNNLREAWFSEQASQLIVLPYEKFVHDPRQALQRLYELLREPVFTHDLDHVAHDEPTYDADLGTPSLHRVRPKVAPETRTTCLPPDLFAKYAEVNFWANSRINHRGVTVV